MRTKLIWMAGAAAAFALGAAGEAGAVPAFAVQTGQPCEACHVGGFGPQLTPFGRNFKLHGYTQRSNSFNVPLSAMAMASFVNTSKPQPVQPGFAANNNWAVDQVSLFLAGGLGEHLGAFVQATYDGVAHAFTWDNADIRATTDLQVLNHDVLVGASLNNNPTFTDAWNTLPGWGFPYTSSALAPSPSASPLLNGALAQTSIGVTTYAWVDNTLYIEAGAYGSPGASTLTHLGADPTSPGSIEGLAPYARVAVQRAAFGGTLEAGAFGMLAGINPGLDQTTMDVDGYADWGLDASYYRPFENGDVVTANGRVIFEGQNLRASCDLAGTPGKPCAHANLTDVRADVSYYWRKKIGATVQVFNTSGSANPFLYAGNRTYSPNSTGVMFQVDGTPFGGSGSPLGPRFNMRLGLQYSLYTQYNGAGRNWDGAGSNAGDNNTVRVFAWFAY